jgi:hypothetical protein
MSGQDFGPPANADEDQRERAAREWFKWWTNQPQQ